MNGNVLLGFIGSYSSAGEAFDSLYEILQKTAEGHEPAESRDGGVSAEIINAIITITDPTKGFCSSETRKTPVRYAIGELLYYLSGSNRLSYLSHLSSVWNRLSDDGETVNSAYGHRIFHHFGFDQWAHVRRLLLEQPNTRQAIIHIKDASCEPTKDLPCTVSLQFFLRDGLLHMTTYMRSNDIWLGFPYDVFAFTSLQCLMAMELDVNIGQYTHIAGSLHLYTRNVSKEE